MWHRDHRGIGCSIRPMNRMRVIRGIGKKVESVGPHADGTRDDAGDDLDEKHRDVDRERGPQNSPIAVVDLRLEAVVVTATQAVLRGRPKINPDRSRHPGAKPVFGRKSNGTKLYATGRNPVLRHRLPSGPSALSCAWCAGDLGSPRDGYGSCVSRKLPGYRPDDLS
jgi:hypothetical protein